MIHQVVIIDFIDSLTIEPTIGSNKYCLDKNFGGWLIIWDRMFGTFQEELPDVPIVYGLVDQVKSYNPLYVQVWLICSVKTIITAQFSLSLSLFLWCRKGPLLSKNAPEMAIDGWMEEQILLGD